MTTIVTRLVKGSPLNWQEGDNNFTNLNNDKLELSDLVATNVSNTPAGTISASTVQGAINELDSEKVPLNGTGATGTWDISISGNANTATTANTAETATTATTATNIADEAVSTTAKIVDNIITPEKLTQKLTQVAAVTAAGTAVDFTGIPSWVKRITVLFSGVSGSGSSNQLLQLGTSSGVEATGYLGSGSGLGAAAGTLNGTTGFILNTGTASIILHGSVVFHNLSGNLWTASGVTARSDNASTQTVAGSKSLSATLNRIRITHVNGTDTFDAGTISLIYEG